MTSVRKKVKRWEQKEGGLSGRKEEGENKGEKVKGGKVEKVGKAQGGKMINAISQRGGGGHPSPLRVCGDFLLVGLAHSKHIWIWRYRFLSDIPSILSPLPNLRSYMYFPLLAFPIVVAYYLRLGDQVSPLWSLSTALSSVVLLVVMVFL